MGYALFQLPLTLAPQRFGAPAWLFGVCALWSCVTMAQAAVRGPTSFYVLRFLLGVAESSAFPTIYYLLSLFYSPAEMSMAYSRVATGNSVAHVVGGPIAAGLLHLDGVAGLRGWQWLFIVGGACPGGGIGRGGEVHEIQALFCQPPALLYEGKRRGGQRRGLPPRPPRSPTPLTHSPPHHTLPGLVTLVFASVMRVFLAGEPKTAWFLTPAERDWLHARQVVSSQAGGGTKPSKFRAILGEWSLGVW